MNEKKPLKIKFASKEAKLRFGTMLLMQAKYGGKIIGTNMRVIDGKE